ncbi:MAG: hypothetical protein ACXACY_23470 [Candidatus Hodarchaeales archaeon]
MEALDTLSKEFRDWFLKFKDAYFQKEKGDALKRTSTPFLEEEAQSLGDFNHIANNLGSAIIGIAETMNHFSGVKCNTLRDHVTRTYRGSASKSFKRGTAIRDIIQNVRPDVNMPSHQMPEPRAYGEEDKN